MCDFSECVETNMGKMPLEDYLEIFALQHGYDSYDDMRRDGLCIDLCDVYTAQLISNISRVLVENLHKVE